MYPTSIRDWLVTAECPEHPHPPQQLEPHELCFFCIEIFERPKDQPEKFVVRAFATPRGSPRPIPCTGVVADTLADAQALVPRWMALYRRQAWTELNPIVEEYI